MSLFARAAQLVQVSAIGVLAALSLPGVHAARAEGDLLPPASQLFAWNAPTRREPAPASCAAESEATLAATRARREAAMAQVAELLRIAPGAATGGEVLNGRGYAYPTGRDPQRELLMVELEARRQRALRAAAGAPAGR